MDRDIDIDTDRQRSWPTETKAPKRNRESVVCMFWKREGGGGGKGWGERRIWWL